MRRCGLKVLLAVALILLLFPEGVRPQTGGEASSGALKVSLDRDSAPVGGLVELTLDYRLPEGTDPSGDPKIEGLEDLRIIRRTGGPNQIKIRFLVDRLGPLHIGTIKMTVMDKKGRSHALTAGPLSLTVLSNLGDKPEEARLKPLQDIVPVGSRLGKILPWGLGLAGLAALVIGVLWWIRRRGDRSPAPEDEAPPHVRARRDMEALIAQGLFEKGEVKAYYFCFSAVLRDYLERLRHFPAAEYTTEEITRFLSHDQDRKLLPLLRQADLVKFADWVPTPARKEEDVETALAYFRETAPVIDLADGKTSKGRGTR